MNGDIIGNDIPDDLDLIEHFLGLSDGFLQDKAIRSMYIFEIDNWLYRLGNSKVPTKAETVISVYAKPESVNVKGAYLTFFRDTTQVPPPSFNQNNKMVYVNYGWDQLSQDREILNLIGKAHVILLYREFASVHIWAELQHDAISV